MLISRCHMMEDHWILLERRRDCETVVKAARGGEEGEEDTGSMSDCCSRRWAGLAELSLTGTPCRSRTVGEGLTVQQLRGEERWMGVFVWMGERLLCTSQAFHVCKSKM